MSKLALRQQTIRLFGGHRKFLKTTGNICKINELPLRPNVNKINKDAAPRFTFFGRGKRFQSDESMRTLKESTVLCLHKEFQLNV